MSFISTVQPYFLRPDVFQCNFFASGDRFLTQLHYLQKAGNFTCGETHLKTHHTQFNCVSCSLPVKTGKIACFYAENTSRRIHAIARHKARKSQVTSTAGCKLTFLHFAGEITRGVIADCVQLLVFFSATADIVACNCAGIFACVCGYFCLRLTGIFTWDFSIFACKTRQFCMLVAGKFAWVPHLKLPAKYPLYWNKFTFGCKRIACILRGVLAA